jgi:hypothetical protein
MIKVLIIFSFLLLGLVPLQPAHSQLDAVEQLVLDISKLAELKSILKEMYQGYQNLSTGYNTIKGLAQGSFNLHQLFLSGLLSVSPTVKKYERIAQIIADEQTLLSEYKSALSRFSVSNVFSSTELSYLQTIYSNLLDGSTKNLDALAIVITNGTLRMNDAERLNAIDHIYNDMEDRVNFLRSFDNNTSILSVQRQAELNEIGSLKSIYGLPN